MSTGWGSIHLPKFIQSTKKIMAARKSIFVTGDYGLDYNIYLPTDEDTPPPDSPPTQLAAMLGGSGIIHRLLTEIAMLKKVAKEPMEIEVVFGCVPNGAAKADAPDWEKHCLAPPTAAVWRKNKLGNLGRDKDDQDAQVWRVKRSLSLGHIADHQTLPRPPIDLPAAMQTNATPEIIVIEDNAANVRFTVPEWLKTPQEDKCSQAEAAKCILLKMTAPVCHGDLWWTLTASGTLADKLIVVVSVNDLRQEDIRVSQGISWERTAQDLARELTHNPVLADLCKARHVIVTLHGEGALWMERTEKIGKPSFHLIFDPEHMEEEWAVKTRCDGNAYGFHSCFIAAMAADLMLVERETDQIKMGIKHGLWVMRWLRGLGHGLANDPVAGLPANDLAALILAGTPKAYVDDSCAPKDKRTPAQRLDYKQLGIFGQVTIPQVFVSNHIVTIKDAQTLPSWRIMETGENGTQSQNVDSAISPEPLYGLARRVALLGLRGLENIPIARFGKLITADRDEIEALRNIKRLIHGYCQRNDDTKPLSIAVFGPPGAGKSFGIKEIAKEMFQEKTSFLDFNLSQFSDAADLIGAFHQVRDRVLEGFVPVVFWDEFDSQAYLWLQFLLAPMQDGKFQEGQVTHPIGRCIFVFAGATSYDFEHFGPSEKYPKDDTEAKEAYTSFKLAKGPDFKSRLHATLNVLGPNPRSLFHSDNPTDQQWLDDPSDVCFPVPGAMLLRALLGFAGKKENSRMEMDPGLLAALLETPHYIFGARSLEKIVLGLKENERHGLHRSALPSNEVLAMNVKDLAGFNKIMDRSRQFQEFVGDLAPAIHKAWLPLADRDNPNLAACRANELSVRSKKALHCPHHAYFGSLNHSKEFNRPQ